LGVCPLSLSWASAQASVQGNGLVTAACDSAAWGRAVGTEAVSSAQSGDQDWVCGFLAEVERGAVVWRGRAGQEVVSRGVTCCPLVLFPQSRLPLATVVPTSPSLSPAAHSGTAGGGWHGGGKSCSGFWGQISRPVNPPVTPVTPSKLPIWPQRLPPYLGF
jgi:hypothetical protein